jgi:hypothetical protein
MNKEQRVKCPGCGKFVALRKNGSLWHHNTGHPQYSGSPWAQHCNRSGTLPGN